MYLWTRVRAELRRKPERTGALHPRLADFAARGGVLLALLIAIWFWPVGPQYMPFPPSFDCSKASLPTERTICSDPFLGHTDLEFALFYEDNLGAAMLFHDRAIENRLRQSDKKFLAVRNRCGGSKRCILLQYSREDGVIEDMSGGPHPIMASVRTYRNHYLGAYLDAWLVGLVRPHSAGYRR